MTDQQRVLVVDDIPENIDVLRALLEDDYVVKVALNGEKALEIAGSEPRPDLILLDIMMPGIDGYEVCRRLKSNETTRDIPVLFVSALGEVDDESRGLSLGAVDYLIKPVVPSLVKARVDTHLRLKKAKDELLRQNEILRENTRLREHMERVSRHDLKTPLSFVLNVPEMLIREGKLEADQIELLRMLQKAGSRMLEMINHSTDLWKLEDGGYVLRPAMIDLLPVIRQIIGELRPGTGRVGDILLKMYGLPLDEEDCFPVVGEEMLCYSMLANLIKNAVEASPFRRPVEIQLKKGDPAELVICNQGEVPVRIRRRFFEKYVTAGKEYGVGLGVYSARLMARVMGGEITADFSTPGATRIRVTLPGSLPLDEDEQEDDGGAESRLLAKDILVVGSYEPMKKSVLRLLRVRGFNNLFEAGDLDAAGEVLAREEIDLVLLDFVQGQEHYEKLLQELREGDSALLFLVADPDLVMEMTSRDDLPLDALLKPFSYEQFISKVETLLVSG